MSDIQREVSKKMDSRRIATIRQIDFLLDFLRDNEELRFGRVRSREATTVIKNLWEVCTEELNKLGPPRNAKEWARYWSDLKSRAKSKITDIAEKSLEIGEDVIAKMPPLSQIEKKIMKILQHEMQNKAGQDIKIISSGSSNNDKAALVKEEKDEKNLEMNVEDFISSAPIVEVTVSAVAEEPSPTMQTHSGNGPPLSRATPSSSKHPLPAIISQLTSRIYSRKPSPPQDPLPNQTQSPPPPPSPKPQQPDADRTSPTPKRRRRRVLPPRPVPQCLNCTDFKEFGQMIMKLEESHARTAKLQTDAALKMTEVLKLQAEGMINTGAALRDMANNLSRLLETQADFNKPTLA